MPTYQIDKAFEELESYAKKLNVDGYSDSQKLQMGLLLIARVLAYGLKQIAVEIKDKL